MPPVLRPSMVRISLPSASTAGRQHELTAFPSISTVHEPHSPRPHASFVPVSRRYSLKTVESMVVGSTETRRCFRLPRDLRRSSFFLLRRRPGQAPSDHLRSNGQFVEPQSRGILYGAGNGRRNGRLPQLGNTLRPKGSVPIRGVSVLDIDGRDVVHVRHSIAKKRLLFRVTFPVIDVLKEGVTDPLNHTRLYLHASRVGVNRYLHNLSRERIGATWV